MRYLLILAAFILPTLAYWLYVRYWLNRDANMGAQPWYVRAPWVLLFALGVTLAALVLFLGVLLNPAIPSGDYNPPALIDGKIIPGHVLEQKSP